MHVLNVTPKLTITKISKEKKQAKCTKIYIYNKY